MTRQDIRLVIEAVYKVNAIVRDSYDSNHAIKYTQTNEYLDRILEEYNNLKKEEESYDTKRKDTTSR